MKLLQLEYFRVVARLGNMTRAAEELHIAQPSLSKTIARLEEDIGVPLFDRRGKRIQLNRYGRAFLDRAERSLKELEEGKREVMDLAGLEHGSVAVGSMIPQQMPSVFKEYLKDHPGVKFRLIQVTQDHEIRQRLMSGEIDLCISTMPVDDDEIQCEPLMIEEIFLAVPKGHRLAGRKKVRLAEFADEPFIHQTTEFGLREITDSFCSRAGFEPKITNIAFESTTPEVLCSLVENGFGNAFIPACWWDKVNTSSMAKLHIKSPICQRTVWLSRTKDHYMSAAADDFRKFAIDHFTENK